MVKSKVKKIFKCIVLSLLSVLLVVILAAAVALFWHYPRYLRHKEAVQIAPSTDGTITMMSYNVRCLTPLEPGKKSWFYRAELVMDDLQAESPDIIGFQEATKWQHDYLLDCLPEYGAVIAYRDESVIAEGCPIFYHGGRFDLVDQGAFWLSETPDVMSKDWGAANYRICSYVILTDKASGKDFVVFNTHLDHVSGEARINGIGVVLDKIAQFGGLPAVIMGDLNAKEGSATYISATENFLDARYEAEETVDTFTFHGWGNPEREKRIDYFMVSKNGFDVQRYAVLNQPHDGVWSSDHAPLVLELTME